MIKWFKKKQTPRITTEEKALAYKIIGTLGVSHSDSVLEIFCGLSLCDSGVFGKYGCYIKSVTAAETVDGGEFDYIFLFNIEKSKIAKELEISENLLAPHGRYVVLNTKKGLSTADFNDLQTIMDIEFCTPVCTADFAFIISEQN